jgi:hypothetical protein
VNDRPGWQESKTAACKKGVHGGEVVARSSARGC